jgi:hypothetical protein
MNAGMGDTTMLQKGSNGAGDVKKKWEVIEHYRETMSGREAVSSSLLAVSGASIYLFNLSYYLQSIQYDSRQE